MLLLSNARTWASYHMEHGDIQASRLDGWDRIRIVLAVVTGLWLWLLVILAAGFVITASGGSLIERLMLGIAIAAIGVVPWLAFRLAFWIIDGFRGR
jgi:hypothetical protein